jgi:hypothetical protein
MMKHDDTQISVDKLKRLVSSRFGKRLELRTMVQVDEFTHLEPQVRGQDLFIPIHEQKSFLGTAIVNDVSDVNSENQAQLAEMVKLILQPVLYKVFLARQEDNLKQTASVHFDATNLQPLDMPTQPEEKKINLLTSLIHFVGHDPLRLKKSALLVHEMTERWAFLSLSDIAVNIKSVDDLTQLGTATLFIEDPIQLTTKVQQILLDYLALPKASQELLVIIGSQQPLSVLREQSTLDEKLLTLVGQQTLELGRAPLTEKGLRSALHLMLF